MDPLGANRMKIGERLLLLTYCLSLAGALVQMLFIASSVWCVTDMIHRPDASPPSPTFLWIIAAILNVPIAVSILLHLGIAFWGLKRHAVKSAVYLFVIALVMSAYSSLLRQVQLHWVCAAVELLLAVSSGFLFLYSPRGGRGFDVILAQK
jgi:hypothetical protein